MVGHMNALRFDREQGLHLETGYPIPDIGPGEALIRVRKAGICNTDLEITRGYLDFQGVLGHEFVGVVTAVGSQEDSSWLERRVVGDINAACGRCATCRANRPTHCPNRTTLGIVRHDGAFADYLRLPVRNLIEVPASVSDARAVFTEPLAAACEVLEQFHLRPGERAAVVGDGKLGLLVAQVLRLTGAEVVLIGRHAGKGAIVRRLGVDFRLEPSTAAASTTSGAASSTEAGRLELAGAGGRELVGAGGLELVEEAGSFDLVVECAGNQSGLETAKRLVRPRGTIVLKTTWHGTTSIPLSLYVVDEVTLLGSRCGPFAPALRLLERELIDVDALVCAEHPLLDGLAAFEAAFGRGNLKVLLDMEP